MSEKSRSAIYSSFADLFGEVPAAELMSFFPTTPDTEPASRGDLTLTRLELRMEMEGLRADMAELRTEVESVRTEVESVRTEVQHQMNRLMLTQVTTIGVATAVLGTILSVGG